jgi:cation:H+ antiporter
MGHKFILRLRASCISDKKSPYQNEKTSLSRFRKTENTNLFILLVSISSMITDLIFIGIGFVLLWKGSDFFVKASAEIAKKVGVSDLVIGLTLVSASTSLPELMVSVIASFRGAGGIAVGNVVGSNITNIALILGICMILEAYSVEPLVLRWHGSGLFLVSSLFIIFVLGDVSRTEGVILFSLFFVYLWALSKEKHSKREIMEISSEVAAMRAGRGWKTAIEFVIGGIAIFIGARLLVNSAVHIAEALHVCESAIGATIVAFGTSLPEFAVSLRALKEGYEQIMVGNILGSNIFNILLVIGASAMVSPLVLDTNLLYFNIPLMMGVTVLLLAFMKMRYQLERWQGMLFVMLYIFFIFYNYV